jgi:hypothetical protein
VTDFGRPGAGSKPDTKRSSPIPMSAPDFYSWSLFDPVSMNVSLSTDADLRDLPGRTCQATGSASTGIGSGIG